MTSNSHTAIRASLLERIRSGEWPLGGRIPGEAELAAEYGCARTTLNRAMRSLAEDGLVVRRRKGGTRVSPAPARRATVEIPLLREQVEQTGACYGHDVRKREMLVPPPSIRQRLNLRPNQKALFLHTVHLADSVPFAFEVRWVNTKTVPQIMDEPFTDISVNEWLVRSVPFSSGDVVFAAENVDAGTSEALGVPEGSAVFSIDRTTWLGDDFITTMKLFYRPGFELRSSL